MKKVGAQVLHIWGNRGLSEKRLIYTHTQHRIGLNADKCFMPKVQTPNPQDGEDHVSQVKHATLPSITHTNGNILSLANTYYYQCSQTTFFTILSLGSSKKVAYFNRRWSWRAVLFLVVRTITVTINTANNCAALTGGCKLVWEKWNRSVSETLLLIWYHTLPFWSRMEVTQAPEKVGLCRVSTTLQLLKHLPHPGTYFWVMLVIYREHTYTQATSIVLKVSHKIWEFEINVWLLSKVTRFVSLKGKAIISLTTREKSFCYISTFRNEFPTVFTGWLVLFIGKAYSNWGLIINKLMSNNYAPNMPDKPCSWWAQWSGLQF